MPMEPAHIVSEDEEEEEEECEEEEDGTLITMDTTLGLDKPVSHFFHIIFMTIYSCMYAHMCMFVCVKLVFQVADFSYKFIIWD
jgi:hypothetical protein